MLSKLVVSVVFSLLIHLVSPYRILVVYPSPANSHQRGQQAITQRLAEVGHEVVLIGPMEPPTSHPNVTFINVKGLMETRDIFVEEATKNPSFSEFLEKYLEVSRYQMELIFETPDVVQLMSDDSQVFDCVIIENLGQLPIYAFGPHFNAPTIGLLSIEASWFSYYDRGLPAHPVLHPGVMLKLPLEPTFLERLAFVYQRLAEYVIFRTKMAPIYDELIKKYFKTDLKYYELSRAVSFFIEELSPVVTNNRPLLPNTVQIGFLHIEPPKPLPDDLQRFMDSSEHGVVYVSFGSTFPSISMDPFVINSLKTALSSLPYDVLWKYENDSMPDKPPNVRLIKWAPQLDLLAHPKLRLFVTQGGSQSMEEFIARGVAAVAIPYFGDQEYNSLKIEQIGVGKCVFKKDISAERLRDTISEVIANPKYRLRSQELYRIGTDTMKTPLETAVWWIEWVIRNKDAPHLKYAGANMPWYLWFLLDVILAHVLVILALTWVFWKIVRCCRTPKKPKTD